MPNPHVDPSEFGELKGEVKGLRLAFEDHRNDSRDRYDSLDEKVDALMRALSVPPPEALPAVSDEPSVTLTGSGVLRVAKWLVPAVVALGGGAGLAECADALDAPAKPAAFVIPMPPKR